MASTIGRRLSTLSSFYKYCQIEDILDKNPALERPPSEGPRRIANTRPGSQRTRRSPRSSRTRRSPRRCADDAARVERAADLRSLNADIDDFSTERGHRTLAIVRKGGKHVTIPIAPRTGRALDLYIGERTIGPIFLGVEGGRMDRYCADRMVKRLVKRAGIDKHISPHSLAALVHHRRPRRRGSTPRRPRSSQPRRPQDDDALRPGPTQPRSACDLHRVDVHRRSNPTGLTITHRRQRAIPGDRVARNAGEWRRTFTATTRPRYLMTTQVAVENEVVRKGARSYATTEASSCRRWSLVSERAARRERARIVLSAHPWNSGTSWRSVPAAM